MPEKGAWCPMAHMITPDQLRDLKALNPEAAVVCYVNSTAEIKAESDICCTSANGVQVVNSLPEGAGHLRAGQEPGRIRRPPYRKEDHSLERLLLCARSFHYPRSVKPLGQLHPSAEVLVHPECRPEVIDQADFVYSTAGMGRHAKASKAREFIIGTETGMIYRLKKENPEKEFYPLSEKAICQNMKKTNSGEGLPGAADPGAARHCARGDRAFGRRGRLRGCWRSRSDSKACSKIRSTS